MKPKNWLESANLAIEGILYVVRTQRHMRWHFLSAIAILIISLLLGLAKLEFIALTLAIILVLLAEMLNTAVEVAVDLFQEEFHPLAKISKDIAAGAVLIAASGAIVIGYLILFPQINRILTAGTTYIKQSPEHITFISLIIVVIAVIITKAYTGKGLPLRGGLPSGHAAIAFSVWISITYITGNILISLLTLFLSLIVSRSRIVKGIHTLWEVMLGALLGSVITFLLFKVFYSGH
jgi:diacylglycerol kinase (ATP)